MDYPRIVDPSETAADVAIKLPYVTATPVMMRSSLS